MTDAAFSRFGSWITFRVLLPLSYRLANLQRPRAYWLAGELQFIGHGLIGNGWRDAMRWK